MQIPGNIPPFQPPRRRAEPARARPSANADATPTQGSAETPPASDATLSNEAIARYVDQLKSIAPEQLHRVEELRSRIADGSYRASPDELAGPLADLLGGGSG